MKKVLLALIVFWALPANANVMTFSDILNGDGQNTYSEDGILATGSGGGVGVFFYPEAAHLDDGGSGFARFITFTMATRFDALSFDIKSNGFDNWLALEDSDGNTVFFENNIPFENVLVQGFRGGSLVASDAFNMLDFSTYVFSGFLGIDALTIGFTSRPTASDFAYLIPGGTPGFECDSPCSHFDVDNVTLQPVPLPAAAFLLLGGLGMLGAVCRRGRKNV